MLRFFKEYFSLTNNEQRGIIGLVLIILFVFGTTRMYLLLQAPKEIPQNNTALLALLNPDEIRAEEEFIAKDVKIEYFYFDPNTANRDALISLGFKENVASTLINFRSKGGKFYQKEDLKKVYGIDEPFYQTIEAYIAIPKQTYPKSDYTKETSAPYFNKEQSQPKQAVNLNLNTADSASLTSVKGIGPAYASRIVKYRNLLGGFKTMNQLLEVYGITSEVFEGIKDQLFIDGGIQQINVNTATWYELKNHPYINSELANIILNFKKAHGQVENFNFLLESKLISQENYNKLTPYLTVE